MADLDAGILDKRVTVQVETETADGSAGFTSAWADVGTYWAQVKPMGAKQIFEYDSLNVKATHRVKFRAAVPVEENHRLLYGSRVLNVLTVENEDEADVVKWVTCEEVRN